MRRCPDLAWATAGHADRPASAQGTAKQSVNYVTERVVGNGSFGVVFQATCQESGEVVSHLIPSPKPSASEHVQAFTVRVPPPCCTASPGSLLGWPGPNADTGTSQARSVGFHQDLG